MPFRRVSSVTLERWRKRMRSSAVGFGRRTRRRN